LEDIFAFLLEYESLDFSADLLIRAELLRFLVLQAHDVKAFRGLNRIRNASGHQGGDGALDPRQELSLPH
jgi:hypothetical protein